MNKPFAIDTNESWGRELLGFKSHTGLLEATKDNETDDTYSLQLHLESTVEDIRVPITHTENRCTCGFHAVDSSTYDLEVRVGKYRHYNQTTFVDIYNHKEHKTLKDTDEMVYTYKDKTVPCSCEECLTERAQLRKEYLEQEERSRRWQERDLQKTRDRMNNT
ncbi:hypothetical protein EON65_58400 [archaeon]|nr:MAG: hypothetical protein EON65_58400 [archaeon]